MRLRTNLTRSACEFSANRCRFDRCAVFAALLALPTSIVSGQTSPAETSSVPEARLAANSATSPFDPQQGIAQQSRQLLQLTEDLKSEVDKSRVDILSLDIVRTATAIENLARGVKDRIKHSPGAR